MGNHASRPDMPSSREQGRSKKDRQGNEDNEGSEDTQGNNFDGNNHGCQGDQDDQDEHGDQGDQGDQDRQGDQSDQLDDATFALSEMTLQSSDILFQTGDSVAALLRGFTRYMYAERRIREYEAFISWEPEPKLPSESIASPVTSLELHNRLMNLPQELYDNVLDLVIAIDDAPTDGHYILRIDAPSTHHPFQLRICHALREKFASAYYGGSAEWVFSTRTPPTYQTPGNVPIDSIVVWLRSLRSQDRAALTTALGWKQPPGVAWSRSSLPYYGMCLWFRAPSRHITDRDSNRPGLIYFDWSVRFGLC